MMNSIVHQKPPLCVTRLWLICVKAVNGMYKCHLFHNLLMILIKPWLNSQHLFSSWIQVQSKPLKKLLVCLVWAKQHNLRSETMSVALVQVVLIFYANFQPKLVTILNY